MERFSGRLLRNITDGNYNKICFSRMQEYLTAKVKGLHGDYKGHGERELDRMVKYMEKYNKKT